MKERNPYKIDVSSLIRGTSIVKRLFIWSAIFLLFCTNPSFSADKNQHTSNITYDVYAGGVHALDARLTIKTTSSNYDATLTAATQGLLKKLANWSGKFTSKGLISQNIAAPLTHISTSTWKEETESKTFKYNGHGKFLSYKVIEGNADKTPTDIDKSLAIGTMDNLTATLNLMMTMPVTKACKGDTLVYDGDRTYRLIFSDTRIETLKKSNYNIYDGQAISCTVEVKPEKGKWRKKPRGWLSLQEQGRQKGSLPTIWFGEMPSHPDIYVPVKIRVKTDYGTLFMHMTSAKTEK